MSKWIDADALKAKKRFYTNEQRYVVWMTDIYNAPSIDIVRCKECKHWHKWSDGEMFCGCLDGGIGSDADDFCSYGERKGE